MDELGADGTGRSEDDLAHLIAAHTPALYGYCLSLLGEPDETAAALADALAIAGRAEPDSRMTDEAVRPWLFALARNEVVRRRPSGPWKPPVHAPELPDDPDTRHREGRVRTAASRLSPFHRELLDLSLRHRLTEPEIGYVLDVNSAAVTSQLAEATVALVAAFAAVDWPDDPDPAAEVGPVTRYAALPLLAAEADPARGPQPGSTDDPLPAGVAAGVAAQPVPWPSDGVQPATAADGPVPVRADAPEGRHSGVIGPRLPASRRRHRWVVAATVALVLFAVAGVVAIPTLFAADPLLTVPALGNPTVDTGTTPASATAQSPGSGLGVASGTPTPSASASVRPTPTHATVTGRPRPPKPPGRPVPGLTVTSSLADTTQGCPPGWTAVIYINVGGGTPARVWARWWFQDGSTAEQIATDDGGGRYHVVIGGLPYDQSIGYGGRAADGQGRDTLSAPSYVSRRSNCSD